jgi:hypothetical protein
MTTAVGALKDVSAETGKAITRPGEEALVKTTSEIGGRVKEELAIQRVTRNLERMDVFAAEFRNLRDIAPEQRAERIEQLKERPSTKSIGVILSNWEEATRLFKEYVEFIGSGGREAGRHMGVASRFTDNFMEDAWRTNVAMVRSRGNATDEATKSSVEEQMLKVAEESRDYLKAIADKQDALVQETENVSYAMKQNPTLAAAAGIGRATGGSVPAISRHRDDIPINVEGGEFVLSRDRMNSPGVRAAAYALQYGGPSAMFDSLSKMNFNKGGLVLPRGEYWEPKDTKSKMINWIVSQISDHKLDIDARETLSSMLAKWLTGGESNQTLREISGAIDTIGAEYPSLKLDKFKNDKIRKEMVEEIKKYYTSEASEAAGVGFGDFMNVANMSRLGFGQLEAYLNYKRGALSPSKRKTQMLRVEQRKREGLIGGFGSGYEREMRGLEMTPKRWESLIDESIGVFIEGFIKQRNKEMELDPEVKKKTPATKKTAEEIITAAASTATKNMIDKGIVNAEGEIKPGHAPPGWAALEQSNKLIGTAAKNMYDIWQAKSGLSKGQISPTAADMMLNAYKAMMMARFLSKLPDGSVSPDQLWTTAREVSTEALGASSADRSGFTGQSAGLAFAGIRLGSGLKSFKGFYSDIDAEFFDAEVEKLSTKVDKLAYSGNDTRENYGAMMRNAGETISLLERMVTNEPRPDAGDIVKMPKKFEEFRELMTRYKKYTKDMQFDPSYRAEFAKYWEGKVSDEARERQNLNFAKGGPVAQDGTLARDQLAILHQGEAVINKGDVGTLRKLGFLPFATGTVDVTLDKFMNALDTNLGRIDSLGRSINNAIRRLNEPAAAGVGEAAVETLTAEDITTSFNDAVDRLAAVIVDAIGGIGTETTTVEEAALPTLTAEPGADNLEQATIIETAIGAMIDRFEAVASALDPDTIASAIQTAIEAAEVNVNVPNVSFEPLNLSISVTGEISGGDFDVDADAPDSISLTQMASI